MVIVNLIRSYFHIHHLHHHHHDSAEDYYAGGNEGKDLADY